LRRTSYSEGEVRALVEEYAAFKEKADTSRSGLRFLVMLADLDKAMESLPMKWWSVVLLHGLIGIPQMEVARLLQVSHQAVSKRYRLGLEEIHYLINGGA
jgi:DNA-directed RNA polymerase specialized sigma24 family protein